MKPVILEAHNTQTLCLDVSNLKVKELQFLSDEYELLFDNGKAYIILMEITK